MSDTKNGKEKFNNPFSALKGLSVSGAAKNDRKDEAKKPAPRKPVSTDSEEEVDFLSEMAGLGVREIAPGGMEKPAPQRDVAPNPEDVPASGEPSPVTESGRGVARPRRERLLRRGQVTPQAELDLHGVTADGVREKVGWFLENAAFHGFEAVRIITGRGSHSEAGPVLRPLVEQYLDGPGRRWSVEWLRAPKGQGGDGALIVFIRK